MATVACVRPARSRVTAVSVVCVAKPGALSAASASAGIANAMPSPATNLSRRLRQTMPITCTCSKSQERIAYRPIDTA